MDMRPWAGGESGVPCGRWRSGRRKSVRVGDDDDDAGGVLGGCGTAELMVLLGC